MHPLLYCIGGVCYLAARTQRNQSGRRRDQSRIGGLTAGGMRAIGTAPDGDLVFVSGGPALEITCPTGETCDEACKCSGVSASGVVGVGAKCECITTAEIPGVTPLPAIAKPGFTLIRNRLSALPRRRHLFAK